ncbi:MAG TPA: hypothetical protein VFM88_17650 [Vicinamibacteria bacterium]|nr:hypothetical protein [Vicinamibacteria bacterium]
MTWTGGLVIDALALAFLIWVLNLVRIGRLYVGYGVILVALAAASAGVVSITPLRAATQAALARLFGAGGPLVVALCMLVLLLAYVLTQVTLLASRLATLVQELAIRHAAEPPRSSRPAS